MKRLIPILISAVAVSGCASDAQMADRAHIQCKRIGYDPSTPEYTACVERGFRGTQQTQEAAVAATSSAIATAIIIDALF